jgi:hypothetical protein
MRSFPVTRQQLRSMLLAELSAVDVTLPESDDIDLVPVGTSWHPVLRRSGGRLDEAQLAALCEIGRRLAKGYVLAN